MSYGGGYPFWLKNQADNASANASMARREADKERSEKEEYQKQMANVEKVIHELKLLLEKGRKDGSIEPELFELINEKIKQVKTK
ncbi:hypothetical protein [Candidatus Nitrosotenuis cloacae]|uniref:Uncharacterized protein n=1 Tax=Candidatus Nitrosotenuis cloacae TaxID=1603555 RepID=A0A3G1B052_9ARCH|nr:hypothetical protein [Candidatus Nitrosotenuis cloacae]AJZ75117.1 hypothetical protein SU86_000495 [Candidatus Nitrosotenuis cloacae]